MLKIGLAGVGYLGSRHLKHLLDIDGIEVTGIWDVDPEVMKNAQSEFGVTPASSLSDLINAADAVDVVTPTTTHLEVGLKVIQAGKPLMIEKPICATYTEGKQLLEAADQAGIPIQVGHIERFNRAFRSLDGVEIKPQFIEAHRLSPWNPRGVDVAVVHDLMIHDLDLILALADSEPEHVHANGVGVVTDSVDIATARIEFSSGMVANVTASRISLKRMRKLRLFGQKEYITLDLGKGICEHVTGTLSGFPLPQGAESLGEISHQGREIELYRRFPKAVEGDALRLELESFRDVALTGDTPRVSGSDALKALALAERIVTEIKGDK